MWREAYRLWLGAGALALCLTAFPAAAEELQPITTVLHVHSRMSTGTLDLDGLAAEARRFGIGALIMSENLVLRYEYGLFPLRGVIRAVKSWPSVTDFGVERYLAELRAASRRHPDVMFVPGVEVVPHYYWTGSLRTKDLTMHDGQKNLLLIGPDDPAVYRGIPAAGNVGAYTLQRQSVVELVLVMGIGGAGVWVLTAPRTRRARLTHGVLGYRSRRWGRGLALLLIAVLVAINAFPFLQPPFDIYDAGLGVGPHQAVIDYGNAHGGLTIWSMPEAPDLHRVDYGRLGTVTIKTEPYPQLLDQTEGYTAFGAVYAQPVTVTEAGGRWDGLLRAYNEGKRAAPVWGVAEAAFHGTARGKRLAEAETVVWARARSQAAVLEALRLGRAYARRRGEDYALVLETFSVSAPGSDKTAISGGLLRAPGPFLVRLRITASDGVPRSVPVRIIRDGTVIWDEPVQLPADLAVPDEPPADPRRTYYRVMAGGAAYRLASNPIFVQAS